MSVSVGDIVASFKFDTSGIDKGSKDAVAGLTKIGTASVATGTLIADLAMNAARSFVQLAQAPVEAALAAGRYAESIENMSHATGLSANQLQTYQVILNRTGLELTDLQVSFRTLATKMKDAMTPGTESAKMFEELGIVLTGSEGPAEMLDVISDKLKDLPDGFEKTSIATDLLGRSGMKLIPALKDGSVAFTQAGESARLMGVIMSDEARARAMQLDDAMDDLKLSQQAFSNTVGSMLSPAMATIVSGFTGGINKITAFIQRFDEIKEKSGSWAAGIAGAMAPLDKPGTVKKDGETLRIMPAPSQSELDAMQKALGVQKEQEKQLLVTKGLTDYIYGANRLREFMPQLSMLEAAELARKNDLNGTRIVLESINKEHLKEAKRHAQVYAGEYQRTQLLKEWRESQVQLNNALEEQVRIEELNQNFQPRNNPGADKRLADLEALKRLYPEASIGVAELNAMYDRNIARANEVQSAEQKRHALAQDVITDLEREHIAAEADFTVQKAWYSQAPGLIGAADAVRQRAFQAFNAEIEVRIAKLEEEKRRGLIVQEDYNQQLLQMDAEIAARRIQIVQQYPDFWEQQLNAIVQGNAFSMAQIVNSGTSAFAQWAVQGTQFKQFWISLQTSLVQAVAQMGIQKLAQLGIQASQEIAIEWMKESGKTAAVVAGVEARTAATAAEGAAAVSVWDGMATGFSGMMQAVNATTMSAVQSIIGALTAAWTFTKAVLGSIAAAMKATVFGIPVGVAITAALIAGSIAVMNASKAAGIAMAGLAAGSLALTVLPFASGGVVTRPTLGLVGEAGPEAIIPLSQMGNMTGGGGPMEINLQIDGRTFAELAMKYMPGQFYFRTGHA